LAFLLCPREVLVTIPALAPIARAENHPAEFPTIPPNGLPSVNLGQWEGYRLLQGIASCESWGDPTGAVSSSSNPEIVRRLEVLVSFSRISRVVLPRPYTCQQSGSQFVGDPEVVQKRACRKLRQKWEVG